MPYDGIEVRADYCNRTFSGRLENDGQLSHLPIYLGPVGERQPIRRQITQILSHYLFLHHYPHYFRIIRMVVLISVTNKSFAPHVSRTMPVP